MSALSCQKIFAKTTDDTAMSARAVRETKVEIRLAENPGSVKAYADVRFLFSDGELQIRGFAIIQTAGKDAFVAFPQNRGRYRYFPVATATGSLHNEIVKQILRAYEQAKERN